eukprot:Protomagalhaensia_sp_Gyna_25__4831@NODE_498_length_3264_cov_226_150388_g389_i0_p1_GENE_NODE_498_length_3264_cov_226_150388_g389_i0NODE_498_length_3264_cov_226_150388_g389_i0_p1_ORF_typecomplete_len489_score86_44Fer4_14/PF13394_6/8_3e12Radical_SAM/PF04055_21/1_8e10Fer4_12/PF13353_6/0_014_NODE_498_length_3264_cov_226_150388_g389_i0891555
MTRERRLEHPSCLNFHQLRRDFLESSVISRAQLDSFVRGCICSDEAIQLWDKLVHSVKGPDAEVVQESIDWATLCTDLPQAFYQDLKEKKYRLMTSNMKDLSVSEKGDTVKILLELQDHNTIETCLMRTGDELKSRDSVASNMANKSRTTVCVSSQIGCRMACSFCATGTLGLKGNLNAGEILEQVAIANVVERKYRGGEELSGVTKNRWLRNVVFMGMGEPLDNYDEVIRAAKILTSQNGLSFAPSRVTISTVGFSPKRIRSLKNDVPRISLALSLHAPTDAMRAKLIPSATPVDLKELMTACFEFVANQRELSKSNAKRQGLFIEYCLIDEVNDTEECIGGLEDLLRDHKDEAILNVIPYNPTEASSEYKTPSDEKVEAFAAQLKAHGLRVFVRHEFGRDISGACGQLAAKHLKVVPKQQQQEHHAKTPGSDTSSVTESPLSPVSAPDQFAPVEKAPGFWSSPLVLAGTAFVVGVAVGRVILRNRR